jgi:hypothetical protein
MRGQEITERMAPPGKASATRAYPAHTNIMYSNYRKRVAIDNPATPAKKINRK